MRAVLVGIGAVGRRVASQLLGDAGVEQLTVVHRDPRQAARRTEGLGDRVVLRTGRPTDIPPGSDVVVVTIPAAVGAVARAALAAGAHVVSVADDVHDVRTLVALDGLARAAGRSVAVGAAMAPGLSCVLCRYGSARLERVEQIHVASVGTGGPACARHHHAALSAVSTDWYDGEWRRRAAGSGRELVWFPGPVGGADCYRARRPDPALLLPAFAGVERVTTKMEATRRDRLTAALPMLRRPHPEGTVGAVRVELRGWVGPAAETVILGASGRPALVAGTVAALAARWAVAGRLARNGAAGLAELVDEPGAFLRELSTRGIAASIFEGLAAGEVGAGR